MAVLSWRKVPEYKSEINSFCSGGFCSDAMKQISRSFQKEKYPDYLIYEMS
jgi:hypothetical protein